MVKITSKKVKDLGASILARLKNHAKENKIQPRMIYLAYIFEKFLYRVAISKYRSKLVLKGGVLLYCENWNFRQTTDIDFLGLSLSNKVSNIIQIIQEICTIPCNDPLQFYVDDISIQENMIDDKYNGFKITIPVSLSTLKEKLNIDIGFGDVIYPNPRSLNYPILFKKENKSIIIQAYTIESFVAEKIHAIYYLGAFSSRMKDFYDLYCIAEYKTFELMDLLEAIKLTFKKRDTKIQSRTLENILDDDIWNQRFIQYCRKKHITIIPFEDVSERIKKWLLPIFKLIEENKPNTTLTWDNHLFLWKAN
ncbi:MAG: nucleotidyl transferase AbiEii/AbiGii toxin family protein [Candidatus Lokiarchaeota archaeon]|nr:nucleotidyl transferase AbiEii/AbiGii toxin family protein [Candidatus Harpocratesius repetitus]